MERLSRVIILLVLAAVGLSAVLSIRAHYMVWKYSPPRERLPRPNS
jgi:hypothetical protein